jgi:hypothetical protein
MLRLAPPGPPATHPGRRSVPGLLRSVATLHATRQSRRWVPERHDAQRRPLSGTQTTGLRFQRLRCLSVGYASERSSSEAACGYVVDGIGPREPFAGSAQPVEAERGIPNGVRLAGSR